MLLQLEGHSKAVQALRGASVSMLTRDLNSYRIAFFEETRRTLANDGIEFNVYVGGATSADRAKNDPAELEWATSVPARQLTIGHRDLWWQPVIRLARRSDLIITEQASKQLSNVPLSILQRAGWVKHCLWGHGRNFQESIEGSSGEGVKKWFTRPAHWFFSYTSLSTDALIESGYPSERITTFRNSTDVEEVRAIRDNISEEELDEVRTELNLGDGPVVGYLGGLYAAKRVGFLLESLDALRLQLPDVQVVVIGSGSDATQVEANAQTRPWIHYAGSVYGGDRVKLALCCDLLLMPGLVGLNIVDGFAMGLPTITTAINYHSPEIAYLQHDKNGWVCPADVTAEGYANQVAKILTNAAQLRRLRDGAEQSADELGTHQMVELFTDGVKRALQAPARGRLLRRGS